MKYEDKILNMCHIQSHSLKTPLSTAQAVLLRAIAPKVAGFIFNRKFYGALLWAINDELTKDPLDLELANDKERTNALLLCLAELVSSVPAHDYAVVQEEIISFHDKCQKRGTVGLYIDLIEYYCRNTAHDYVKHSHLYTTNVLNYMNDPDAGLVGRVVVSFTSILNKLSVENRWALVPRIRDAFENAGLGTPADDFLIDAMGINLYSRKVNSFTML